MATKFASPPLTFTPAPAPNIRVAYIAGPATIAANDAVSELPNGEANKTLDDIALNKRGFTPEFQRLLDAVNQAKRVADDKHFNGYLPASAHYEELLAAYPRPQLIEHIEVYGGVNYEGQPIIRSSASFASVAGAVGAVKVYGRRIDPVEHDRDYDNMVTNLRSARQILAVHKWRERQQKRADAQADAYAREGSGLEEAIRQSDRAGDDWADALDAFLAYPAQNAAELEEQYRLNKEEDCEHEGVLLASALRLLGSAEA